MPPEFEPFRKIARLSREVVITEKLDGTNASILITDDGQLFTGSRSRWITPEDDNFGFAKWAAVHREELLLLGPGHHFGEWWGQGIQRNYSLREKRFSLFNVAKWTDDSIRPACCHVVPILFDGQFENHMFLGGVKAAFIRLKEEGSVAAPGFMKPEGIIIYHKQGNLLFKKTLEKDEEPKGLRSNAPN